MEKERRKVHVVILARSEGSSHLLLRGVVVDRRSEDFFVDLKMSEIKNQKNKKEGF
jgi:hypothetical protein